MEQGINWGSVADWASAVGSIAASITALYLARASTKIRLKGYLGLRVVVGTGAVGPELVFLNVTNVGTRSTKVTTIAVRTGLLKKRRALMPNWGGPFSHPLPKVLNDAEEAGWSIELDKDDTWFMRMTGFASTWWDVETFRMDVHTSNGGLLTLRPEKAMRERMHKARLTPAPATVPA
jgi:hypothetical protein